MPKRGKVEWPFHSTVTSEINRNSGVRGTYNWETTQKNADYRKIRRPGNRAISQEIKDEAVRLLVEEQWSREQISAALKEQGMSISHETIYKIIRADKKNGGSLYLYCRHKLKHRARPVSDRGSTICNRVYISERPEESDGRRFGDFEMDTIVGKGNHGAMLTLTEKSTRMLFMRKLNKGKEAKELAKTVVRILMPYKAFLKSITTDNGLEFACHEYITKKWVLRSTSPIHIHHGKKVRLKIRAVLSGNISPNHPLLKISVISLLPKLLTK